MPNTKNRGFVTNSVLALKDFIVKPRLTKEQKKFVLENFEASQQEIKDLIAKYFYVKDDDGTYDLKDDDTREAIIRLIEINSVIRLEDFEILEKYFDGKAEKSLEGKEKEICFLMTELNATRSLYHKTLTQKEELVYFNGLSMYNEVEKIYYFEFLEEYFRDKKRETLDLDDQALYDVIEKYGSKRQKGDIIIFEVKDPEGAKEDIFNLTDADDSEDSTIFYFKGVHKYKKTLNMQIPYRDLSYDALKKERTKLYKVLEAKEN
jgi:hypothetical protein